MEAITVSANKRVLYSVTAWKLNGALPRRATSGVIDRKRSLKVLER